MGSGSNKPRTDNLKREKTLGPWKGVRMRTWGTWVSEIRKPHSKERIWLGSFDAPEKAARAYDAALYCLRGSKGIFNFPDDERPKVPSDPVEPLSTTTIKEIAARFATSTSDSVISSASTCPTTNPPAVVDKVIESESAFGVGNSLVGTGGITDPYTYFADSFLLDEPIPLELNSIWSVLEDFKGFDEPK